MSSKLTRQSLIAIIQDAGDAGITKGEIVERTGIDGEILKGMLASIKQDPKSGVSLMGAKRGARYVINGTGRVADEFRGIECEESVNPLRPTLDINIRFQMLEGLIQAMMTGDNNAMLITGQAGTGKTSTVLETLSKMDLMTVYPGGDGGFDHEDAFMHIKGVACATEVYKALCETPGGTFVFDDCDSVLEDTNGRNVLKAALDTYPTRQISWPSPYIKKMGLPDSFEFTGKIIFISNKQYVDSALATRCLSVDLTMSKDELINRMEEKGRKMCPKISEKDHNDLIEFLRENKSGFREFSLRTYIKIANLIQAEMENWREVAVFAN